MYNGYLSVIKVDYVHVLGQLIGTFLYIELS